MARKKHPKISTPSITRKKLAALGTSDSKGWCLCGFDVSMSSLAGAAIAWDNPLKKHVGPVFTIRRWQKGEHYFDRLKAAAKAHELVLELQAALGVFVGVGDVHIAQEEPFPPHMDFIGKAKSGFLKQQAEISGAFLGGLLRYGYQSIWQFSNVKWRQVVAEDLDISIHYTKWKDPELANEFNCRPNDTGKFRAKQWALKKGIPDWPDIIESSKLGKIPRPENSIAKAVQCDDRYEALAIMEALYKDLFQLGALDGAPPRFL